MGLWKQFKEEFGLSVPPSQLATPPVAQQAPVLPPEAPTEPSEPLIEPDRGVDAETAPGPLKTARIRLKDKPSGLSDEQIAAIKLKTETRAEKNRQRAEDSRARKKAKRDAEKTAQSLVPVDPEKPRPPGNPAWVPGVSGNKEGRTKTKWFTDSLKRMLTEDPSLQDKFVKKCLDLAIKEGDIEFVKELWNRLEGRQSAADEKEGIGNQPIQILFTGIAPRLNVLSGGTDVKQIGEGLAPNRDEGPTV